MGRGRNNHSQGKNSQQYSGTNRAARRGGANKAEVRERRNVKKRMRGKQDTPEKFQELKDRKIKPLQPMNDNQALYMDCLAEKKITICSGASGTGKTYIACYEAAVALLKGDIERIILIRPYEQVGKSIGMRPGTSEEKLTPLMQSM